MIASETVIEEKVRFYLGKAQVIWPDLPWKTPAHKRKVIAAAAPVLFEGQDDEVGYELALTYRSAAQLAPLFYFL